MKQVNFKSLYLIRKETVPSPFGTLTGMWFGRATQEQQ